MDLLLLVAILLSGCIATGEGMSKRSVDDVQNVLNNFDALIKVKGTVTYVPDRVCVTSVDELNKIEKALVRTDDRVADSRDADVSIQFSFSCSKLDRLKTEILKLKIDFAEVIAEPVSSYKYRTLKTNLESKILQFKSFLDSTKKMESGDPLAMAVKMENEFQLQQNRIIEVLNKLESEQKQLNDANVEVAIQHLQQGKLDDAVAAFVTVTDHEAHIERAVLSVYGNDGNNVENICKFIVRLPLQSRENGYKALKEQLKKDQRTLDNHIWMLAAEINRIPEEDRGTLNDVMVQARTMIRDGDIESLLVLLNHRKGLETMSDFIPTLVQMIYEETDNSRTGIETFVIFLHKIPNLRNKLYLINQLVLMLKSTDRFRGKDVTMLVYELVKIRNARDPKNSARQLIVEQNLPLELRDLMYDYLCVQNVETKEYLLAAEQVSLNQRYAHTAKFEFSETFFWRVYFTDNGKKVHIRNTKYNEPLYLIDEGSADDEHVLRSWMAGSLSKNKTAEFYLDMQGNGEFLIVNEHFNQVLYSAFDKDFDNVANNRPVFSKKYDPNNIDIDSKWIIGVCRVIA